MNKKTLAESLGITKNRLSNILAGRANVSYRTAVRFEQITQNISAGAAAVLAADWMSDSPAVRGKAVVTFINKCNQNKEE